MLLIAVSKDLHSVSVGTRQLEIWGLHNCLKADSWWRIQTLEWTVTDRDGENGRYCKGKSLNKTVPALALITKENHIKP